jgi:uncharacterized protein (DUF433 family)
VERLFFGVPACLSKIFFDYLEGGDSMDVFLDDFPTVEREQVLGVLKLFKETLLTKYEVAA